MRFIADNEKEAIEVGRILMQAADSVRLDMTKHGVEQMAIVIALCKFNDSIEIKEE